MTWLALEAEIAAEMRALTNHEAAMALDLYGAGQKRDADRRRFGPREIERRKDRERQQKATDERAAALLAAGDLRALRRLEACRRAQKRRRA